MAKRTDNSILVQEKVRCNRAAAVARSNLGQGENEAIEELDTLNSEPTDQEVEMARNQIPEVLIGLFALQVQEPSP